MVVLFFEPCFLFIFCFLSSTELPSSSGDVSALVGNASLSSQALSLSKKSLRQVKQLQIRKISLYKKPFQALGHLEACPAALVESLLMNEKVSELSAIFRQMPWLVSDERLVLYARKALAFDWAVRESVRDFSQPPPPPPTPATPATGSEELVALTGDEVCGCVVSLSFFYFLFA